MHDKLLLFEKFESTLVRKSSSGYSLNRCRWESINLISRKLSPICGDLGDFEFHQPTRTRSSHRTAARSYIFIEIYRMHAKLVPRLFFFGILPSSAVPPHRILFPLVDRSMRCDYKYRNGHSSPLKEVGEWRTWRKVFRPIGIFQELSRRSRWPCEPILSLRVGRIAHKEYLVSR